MPTRNKIEPLFKHVTCKKEEEEDKSYFDEEKNHSLKHVDRCVNIEGSFFICLQSRNFKVVVL